MLRRPRIWGFTLLEVMVALAIIALSLTAIGASMGQMIQSANTMRDRTYASWIAQNRITEFRLALATPEPAISTGTVQYANAEWAWRAVIEESGVPDLLRIDVSVSFANSDDVIRSVTGFIGAPPFPGDANNAWIQGGGSRQRNQGTTQ